MPSFKPYFIFTHYEKPDTFVHKLYSQLSSLGVRWYVCGEELTGNNIMHWHTIIAFSSNYDKKTITDRLGGLNCKVSMIHVPIIKKLTYISKQGGIVYISSNFPDSLFDEWLSYSKFTHLPFVNDDFIADNLVHVDEEAMRTEDQKSLGHPLADWCRSLIYIVNSWATGGFVRGTFHPNIFLWGISGSGKTFAVMRILKLIGIPRSRIYSAVALPTKFYMEAFMPEMHKVIVFDECNGNSFDDDKIGNIKAIVDQDEFYWDRKNMPLGHCTYWDGIAILISNHSPEEVFKHELQNMIRRFAIIKAVEKNNPTLDVSYSTALASAYGLEKDVYLSMFPEMARLIKEYGFDEQQ